MRDDRSRLLDMLAGARDAREFAAPLTFAEFARSRLHQHAIANAVQNIGEAASRVTAPTRAAFPNIPWKEVVGMRHHIVHGYADIDIETIWRTVQNDLPDLIARLEMIEPSGPA